MILKFENLFSESLQSFKEDILLNKNLTNVSESNMYDILFDCQNFDNITNTVLTKIENIIHEDFNVYVKNLWGFIQTEIENKKLQILPYLKDELSIKPKYTFIYVIESIETVLQIDNELMNLKNGDLVIFKSEHNFEDRSNNSNKILIIGSLTNDLYEDKNQKKLL